ncbi:MAG TPA: dienelactone hydrolase family protein [Vicinamibacterales bacterium]|nr:dienelactone hydrolase family protein [Vicinamibacterales bacterium]
MTQSAALRPVTLDIEGVRLHGDLAIPDGAPMVVIFAHGSGSSRRSPRNRFVADVLRNAGLGTLLMDLLTEAEERVDVVTREHRFDIGLLAARVCAAADWLAAGNGGAPVSGIGLFGASTGAAAALICAARRPGLVRAVVSRGGRPDLAGDALPRVTAPTLLIVGGADDVVIDLNRQAFEELTGEKRFEIIPGATHLFEERGALERVAQLAAEWFAAHGGAAGVSSAGAAPAGGRSG